MAENEIINMLIIAENIMGVYRNFSFLPKRRQVFIVMRTAVEVVLTVCLFCIRVYHLSADLVKRNNFLSHIKLIFHVVVLFSGTIIILCGIRSSSNYKIFITEYMSVENFFQNEPTYTKCLKKLKIIFILASSIFLVTCIINFILKIINRYYFEGLEFFLPYFMLMLVEMMHEVRFMLEHVVLYIYITMLQSYLKCINQFISYTQTKYDYIEKRLYKDRIQKEILPVEDVEHWAKMYECLAICSKHLSMCFKMQMRFALVFSSVHYVTSAYGMFCIFLTNTTNEYFGGINMAYVLLFYIFCTYFTFCAGQNIVNEWSKTHRKLSKLYSTLSVEPSAPEMKSVMNLNLLVRVNPIKIEYTNKVHLGKYLIPTILSLSVSYVITALQINHFI